MKETPQQHQNRKNLRLRDFDYSQDGMYFVTIVTKRRVCLFGSIINGEMLVNDAGRMLQQVCEELPRAIPGVLINPYQVMPNHFYAIITIEDALGAPDHSGFVQTSTVLNSRQLVDLPDIVKRYKSLTTRRYIDGVRQSGWLPFEGYLWQRSYYEHVIRNDRDHQAIVDYIVTNPENWEKDSEYK